MNPSPARSSSSTNAPNGGPYRRLRPTTSNGTPGSGPSLVSPLVPEISLRTPTSGGNSPLTRLTSQTPSSSPTAIAFRRMPPRKLPFPPMEAELVDQLLRGDGWQYEPKWDGFRGVLENLGGGLRLWSRNARPLLRYYPELEQVAALLPPESALDGEIVIQQKGRLDFDALQLRLHPAESRVRKLSAEIPAEFVAFDLLVWKGEPVWEQPLERRAQAGLDGVVAKRVGVPYLPGSRDGVVKVKPYKTADCVIVGFRWSDKAEGRISTLLLGLYRKDGGLDFVGHCSGFPAHVRRELETKLPKLRAPGSISGERVPGGQSRWSRGRELDWNPVKPKLVCEVRYDKLERNRFRHGTRFLRFRPDKDPDQCTWDQVRPRRRRGDPTVESLLA